MVCPLRDGWRLVWVAADLREPLDASDPSTQRLLRILTAAYPDDVEVRMLAARTGLDVGSLETRQAHGRLVRDMIDEAARSDLLGALIEGVLADQATASFHNEIRDLIGPDWLGEHGIT